MKGVNSIKTKPFFHNYKSLDVCSRENKVALIIRFVPIQPAQN